MRQIHNPNVHLSFTDGHPRKAAAAEAYRQETLAKFSAQAAHVGERLSEGWVPLPPATPGPLLLAAACGSHAWNVGATADTDMEAWAAPSLSLSPTAEHVDRRRGDPETGLNSGEKAAIVRALHDPSVHVKFGGGDAQKQSAIEVRGGGGRGVTSCVCIMRRSALHPCIHASPTRPWIHPRQHTRRLVRACPPSLQRRQLDGS